MAKGIDKIRKGIVKRELLNGKPGYKALMEAGYSEASAKHHLKRMPVYKCVLSEIEAEFKESSVTPEQVLCNLEALKRMAIDKQDYATATRCEELKGKYLAMFTDKSQVKAEVISTEEQGIVNKYISTNRICNKG